MNTNPKAWTTVLMAALLAAAPALADECSEFRDSIDAAIAADGYDTVVVAFNDTIDVWRTIEESNLWNPAAEDLIPALAASKESARAASSTRDMVVQLQASESGTGDGRRAETSVHALDDLYHKTMIAFFELVFFAHCGG